MIVYYSQRSSCVKSNLVRFIRGKILMDLTCVTKFILFLAYIYPTALIQSLYRLYHCTLPNTTHEHRYICVNIYYNGFLSLSQSTQVLKQTSLGQWRLSSLYLTLPSQDTFRRHTFIILNRQNSGNTSQSLHNHSYHFIIENQLQSDQLFIIIAKLEIFHHHLKCLKPQHVA